MKILVTGGTGLLGGRLIPKRVEDGHRSPSAPLRIPAGADAEASMMEVS